jgi:hypothetical protein
MKKGVHQIALKYLLNIKIWALTSMDAIQPGLHSDSERERKGGRTTEMELSCAFCRRFRRSRGERGGAGAVVPETWRVATCGATSHRTAI